MKIHLDVDVDLNDDYVKEIIENEEPIRTGNEALEFGVYLLVEKALNEWLFDACIENIDVIIK
jgi:hypothetical protein